MTATAAGARSASRFVLCSSLTAVFPGSGQGGNVASLAASGLAKAKRVRIARAILVSSPGVACTLTVSGADGATLLFDVTWPIAAAGNRNVELGIEIDQAFSMLVSAGQVMVVYDVLEWNV